MATKTYTVNRGMRGNGRDYERGDTRDLDEMDAREMVDSGALSPLGEAPRVRPAAVQHTFGAAEPTGHLDLAIAAGNKAGTPRRTVAAPTTGEP